MNKYECLYVIDAELSDEEIRSCVEKFSGIVADNAGEIEKIDEWGKRRLAYPINYKTEGYYVLMLFAANGDVPAELQRNMRNDEHIMRYVVERAQA